MYFLKHILSFLPFSTLALGATLTYNWQVTQVQNANPDGAFPRTVIGVNGKWPPPTIEGSVGDQVVVNVENAVCEAR